MKDKNYSLETEILNLHEIIQTNQEVNEKKQAASDMNHTESKKKIASLGLAYKTVLKLLAHRVKSKSQEEESSAATPPSKKPSKSVESPEDSDVQSEDEDDEKLSPVEVAKATHVGKTSASSSQSEEVGKEDESSSEDEDFEAVQNVLGNKK